MKLADIARATDGRLIGDGEIEIARPVPPGEAESAADLTLVFSPQALDRALDSPAVAALVAAGIDIPEGVLKGIVEVADPRAALVPLSALFARPPDGSMGIHPTAVVVDGAKLGPDIEIGPYACIGAGAEIGRGSRILAHATIGARARLGADCVVHAGGRIGDDVQIGDRVIIHPNACIGADGFSYYTPTPPHRTAIVHDRSIEPFLYDIRRIQSLGTVILGDDVEIGAGTAIDRATLGATRIGRNTKIDDQVMIGHNCVIGENCILAGQVGLSGSVTLGDRVIMGGRVGVADHVRIGNDAAIGICAVVMRDVPDNAIMMGNPAMPSADYFNRLKHTHISRLGRAADKVRDLAARVARLEAERDGNG